LTLAGSALGYESRRAVELRIGTTLLSAASAQSGTASTRLGDATYPNPHDEVRIGSNAGLIRFISDELFAFGAYERAFGGRGPLPPAPADAPVPDFARRAAAAQTAATAPDRAARIVRDAARVDLGGGDNLVSARAVWEVSAGAGNDRIAAAQVARLDAGDGDNVLALADVVDVTTGGGADTVVAAGAGQIRTGDGADRIAVTAGWHVGAGDGADTIEATDTAYVLGEGGDDVLRVLDARVADGGAGADRIEAFAVRQVDGGEGDDTLVVRGGDVANGGDGADVITGADLYAIGGGAGADTIEATGVVRVAGGAGDDLLTLRRATAAYSRGDGFDTVRAGAGAGVEFAWIRRADVEIAEIRGADGGLAAIDVRLRDGSGGVRIEAAPGGVLADATLSFRDGAAARLGDLLRVPA
jgi:hypothetical protein